MSLSTLRGRVDWSSSIGNEGCQKNASCRMAVGSSDLSRAFADCVASLHLLARAQQAMVGADARANPFWGRGALWGFLLPYGACVTVASFLLGCRVFPEPADRSQNLEDASGIRRDRWPVTHFFATSTAKPSRASGIGNPRGYYGCVRIRVMDLGEANDAFGNNAA